MLCEACALDEKLFLLKLGNLAFDSLHLLYGFGSPAKGSSMQVRLLGLCVLLLISPLFAAQTIITLGGGGTLKGEGPATSASLATPSGLVLDAAGNIVFADTDNNRICRIDAATNQLTVIAGTGVAGFLDGPGNMAQFFTPSDVAIDAAGNVYVADSSNAYIRRIEAGTNIVSTFVGEQDDERAATPNVNFELDYPVGVTIEADNNMYISDEGTSRIYRVSVSGGTIASVAGTGKSGFSGDGGPATSAMLMEPRRVKLDKSGNMVICDTLGHRIRRVDASTGIITTLAGTGLDDFGGDGGPAAQAILNFPTDVVVDDAGNLIIVDADNYRMRQIDAATGIITTVAGTGFDGFSGDGGPPSTASFVFPLGMVLNPGGGLVIADSFNNRIRRIADGQTPIVAYDDDLDGFPNVVEAAALTNSSDAASTPFSNQPILAYDGHELKKLAVKLDFARPNRDQLQFSGSLPVPDGVSIPTQQFLFDFGGLVIPFSLDEKGRSTPKGNNSLKVSTKLRDGVTTYSGKLKNGSFADAFANENLSNSTVKKGFAAIPVTIYFAQRAYLNTAFLVYSAQAGKKGSGKTGRSAFVPGDGSLSRPEGRRPN
jgi:sugar lactone lactonase YvrE